MNRSFCLPRVPKMIASTLHSMQFLKLFSVYALILTIITSATIFYLSSKKPVIISMDQSGNVVQVGVPSLETVVKGSVRTYLQSRYNWTPQSIGKSFKEAESFIHSKVVLQYREAIYKLQKFSVEKGVSQTLYVDSVIVDPSKNQATILGTRITSIQGLKAVGDLKLQLSFESGKHSDKNPWGIYITQEKEF